MNKTLIALIVSGLLSTYAQAEPTSDSHDHEVSEGHHQHSDHQEEDHHEHDSHDQHDTTDPHSESEHGQGEHNDDNHSLDQEDNLHGNDHQEEDHHEHDSHDQHDMTTPHSESEHGHGNHEESSSVNLNSEQLNLANIQINTLTPSVVDYQIYAPGEILSNGYTSYRVSPRVASVVLRRHVTLGDHVQQGQALVTLFSGDMAKAQAEFRKAEPEWKRVQKLGLKTVGATRYIDAKTTFEAAHATLLAYGLTKDNIKKLSSQRSPNLGEYTLRAEINGAVLSDSFEQGQRIEAGAPLITLANEKQLWVEARLPANLTTTIGKGLKAEVAVESYRTEGIVSQEAHTIDSTTRTRTVRLVVDNREHRLHPGQFADVYFYFKTQKPVLTVPETALMRGPDGDWMVYVEGGHKGEIEPVEIELRRSLGLLREISGIEPGSRVVTHGAFFVASQMAKGGFDPHNH